MKTRVQIPLGSPPRPKSAEVEPFLEALAVQLEVPMQNDRVGRRDDDDLDLVALRLRC